MSDDYYFGGTWSNPIDAAEVGGGTKPRYYGDDYCELGKHFIDTNDGIFYTYENKKCCQNHFKQYLKERGVR